MNNTTYMLVLVAFSILAGFVVVLILAVFVLSAQVISLRRKLDQQKSTTAPVEGASKQSNVDTKLEPPPAHTQPQAIPKQTIGVKPSSKSTAIQTVSLVPTGTPSDKIDLNPDFRMALEAMEQSSECVLVTGKAGTGKSTLLRHFKNTTQKSVAILAPTGIAAMNVGGQTIHSFFGFPPRPINADEIKADSQRQEICRRLDAIVIDEISMMRADMMDNIDRFLRVNGRDRNRPFGGTQMILIGDPYQLPPIVADEEEQKMFAMQFKSPFFFDAHVFDGCPVWHIQLNQVYRQSEPEFLEVLNAVRDGSVTSDQLELLNQRYKPDFEPPDEPPHLILTTKNDQADNHNKSMLEKLPGPERSYQCILEGEFNKKKRREKLPTDPCLRLRQGAQVIFVKNDMAHRWVNGTLGRVVITGDDSIRVRVRDANGHEYEHTVEHQTWETYQYKFDPQTGRIVSEVVGRFTQYPLRLAWAITIHKSQGMTLDRVVIDLGNGAFEAGQTYVALSRCRSLEGITLTKPLKLSDIKVDPRLTRFARDRRFAPRR